MKKFDLTSVKKQLLENDFYAGFRFIACLDYGTCIICAGFDNTLIKNIEDAESIEKYGCLNEHCRCMFVPVLKGDVKGSAGMSYAGWFRGLSKEDKKEILGEYYEAYKNGSSLKDIALSFTDEMALKYMQYLEKRERIRKATPVKRKKRLTDEEIKEFRELITARMADVWNSEDIDNRVEQLKRLIPKEQHQLLDYERKKQKRGAKK